MFDADKLERALKQHYAVKEAEFQCLVIRKFRYAPGTPQSDLVAEYRAAQAGGTWDAKSFATKFSEMSSRILAEKRGA